MGAIHIIGKRKWWEILVLQVIEMKIEGDSGDESRGKEEGSREHGLTGNTKVICSSEEGTKGNIINVMWEKWLEILWLLLGRGKMWEILWLCFAGKEA